MEPSLFYTGLVAELYAPLRSTTSDAEPYARFIAACGEPVLELGCGDGDPLLELRARGIDVEGLDASPDMLDRCRSAAAERGLDVVLHQQPMETMDLPGRYRSIFLAGPTFNLLADDAAATSALQRVRLHLAEGGSALIPLFIPAETYSGVGQPREVRGDDGSLLRITTISLDRDEASRTQTAMLRYERQTGATTDVVERPWVLHWHTQAGFRELAQGAGLHTAAVLDPAGGPATEAADVFAFWLTAEADTS